MSRGAVARLLEAGVAPSVRDAEGKGPLHLAVTWPGLDGPRCVAYDQAENRLHSQKAILERVMLGG
jgi:ornithine carbamoyltransferase